jgi:hypothetical protein
MIKDIISSSEYLRVTGNLNSTYVNGQSGLQGVGNVRYNTTNQNLEVYDGFNWIMINMSVANVGLNAEAVALLDWAKKQKEQQEKLERLARENVTIQDALGGLRRAEERVGILQILCEQSQKAENA